jgi:UDP-glucose 4-epimerase
MKTREAACAARAIPTNDPESEQSTAMSVLVTGGAGYIGSHMVYALLEAGERVVVLDNLSSGFAWAVPVEAKLVFGDVADQPLVASLIAEYSVDAIVHFAASISVEQSVADPLGYYRNNVVGLLPLLESAARSGVHFIYSSSASVYGNPVSVPVREDAPLQPVSPYGWSKLMGETIIRDVASAHQLSHLMLRYFNVAGADPQARTGQSTRNATHLIKVAIEAALGLRPGLQVFGSDYPTDDGTCVRDYIHVTDLVAAHLAGIGYLRQGGGPATLNCGYGHGYSVLQVIDVVKRITGVDFPVHLGARRPGDPAALVAASERVRAVLGFVPQFDDLGAIVSHALAWEKKLRERDRSVMG